MIKKFFAAALASGLMALTILATGVPATAGLLMRPGCNAPLSERLRAGGCDTSVISTFEHNPYHNRSQDETKRGKPSVDKNSGGDSKGPDGGVGDGEGSTSAE